MFRRSREQSTQLVVQDNKKPTSLMALIPFPLETLSSWRKSTSRQLYFKWRESTTQGLAGCSVPPKIVDHPLERLPSLDGIGAATELSIRRECGGISIGI
jgi:hypothetical protein